MLGVPRDADDTTIKAAFRDLARRYRPDRSGEPGAEQRFKEIAEAYTVLSDPTGRADYDRDGLSGRSWEDFFGSADFDDLFARPRFDLADDRFARLFGHSKQHRAADLRVDIAVPLERILTGGVENLHLPRSGRCAACQGTGARAGTTPRTCPTCDGTGSQITGSRDGNVVVRHVGPCADCSGRGQTIDDPCAACHGLGTATLDDVISITVPAGISEGGVVRVPRRGTPATHPGAVPGDLLVTVHTLPDNRFTRHGPDLLRYEAVDVAGATLGTQRQIPTLDGDTGLTIPAGTQPGTEFRIRGAGLPYPVERGRGDLVVQVRVRIPDTLTPRQRRLFEQLRTHDRVNP